MAMEICKECGQGVSSKAKLCPHCGAKVNKGIGLIGWVLIILVVFIVLPFVCEEFAKYENTSYKSSTDSYDSTNRTSGIIPSLTITSISYRVTEKNDVWWKYSYLLKIKNNSSSIKETRANIQFLDRDGFVVDDKIARDLVIPSGEEKTFTDYDLIDTSVAGNVASVSAKLE